MRAEDTALRRKAIARALRKAIGRIPQKIVARKAGISESTLSSYLNGLTLAGETKLKAIASATGMVPLELWKAINDHEIEILAEESADEAREGPPVPYETPGGDSLAAPLRRFVRGVAAEIIDEFKAEGLWPPRNGG